MQGQQTSSQAANRCAAYPQQQMPPAGLDMQGQQMPMGYDGGSHQAGPPDAGDAVAGGQRGNPGGGQAYPGAGSGALAGGGSTRAPEAEIKAGWLFKKAESSWGWRKRWSPPPSDPPPPPPSPPTSAGPCCSGPASRGPLLATRPLFDTRAPPTPRRSCCGWCVDCSGMGGYRDYGREVSQGRVHKATD